MGMEAAGWRRTSTHSSGFAHHTYTQMRMSQQEDAEGKKNNIKNQDSRTFPNQSIFGKLLLQKNLGFQWLPLQSSLSVRRFLRALKKVPTYPYHFIEMCHVFSCSSTIVYHDCTICHGISWYLMACKQIIYHANCCFP